MGYLERFNVINKNMIELTKTIQLSDNFLPISVLCCNEINNYSKLPYVFDWTKAMNAYNFNNSSPVIAHAPCAQWSRMRSFAKINMLEKDLAVFCFEQVQRNGGIFEHPSGTSFFKYIGCNTNIQSINQSWFNFPATKKTLLYFNRCVPEQLPLSFNIPPKKVTQLNANERALCTPEFCQWLVNSIRTSFQF